MTHAPVHDIACERRNYVSAPNFLIARKPAWMLDFALKIQVISEIDLTVNLRRELSATFLPSDLPSD